MQADIFLNLCLFVFDREHELKDTNINYKYYKSN